MHVLEAHMYLVRGLGGQVVKVVRLLLITLSVNTEVADSSLAAGRVHSTPILMASFPTKGRGLSPGTPASSPNKNWMP